MPKNAKSSASSATRKKKAQKAANKGAPDGGAGAANGAANKPPQRGQKKAKGKGKEPKKKVYIPPTKPKQEVIDPLDSLGLASLLSSDLVVLLRKAGKKDVVTRSRALEGMTEWIQQDDQAEDGEDKVGNLVMAIPCWAHLFPRLAISPNRRLRQLTSQVNSLLLSFPAFFKELLYQPEQLEAIVGGMFNLAFDPDRHIARMSKNTWEQHSSWQTSPITASASSSSPSSPTEDKFNVQDHLETLLSQLSTILFHESDETGSQSAKASLSTSRDAKNRDDVNVEEDLEGIDARLVHCALGALSWLIQSDPSKDSKEQGEDVASNLDLYTPLMTSPTLWTSLSQQPVPERQRSIGTLSPIVRSAAWYLVRVMCLSWIELLDRCLSPLAYTSMKSAFEENDASVATHMRDGLVTLLRERPAVWKSAPDVDEEVEDDEDEDEDQDETDDENDEVQRGEAGVDDTKQENGVDSRPSDCSSNAISESPPDHAAFAFFIEWLASGLRGTFSNYNIAIVLLSTIPQEVFPPTSVAALSLLNAMYRPIDERAVEGREALRLFVPAFLECLIWTSARISKLTGAKEAAPVVDEMSRLFFVDFIGVEESMDQPEVRVRVATVGEARLVAETATLLRKMGNIDVALITSLLDVILSTLSHTVLHKAPAAMERHVSILSSAVLTSSNVPVAASAQDAIYHRVSELSMTTANIVASGEAQNEGVLLLSTLLQRLPGAFSVDAMASLKLVFDRLRKEKEPFDVPIRASFFTAYVALQHGKEKSEAWSNVLEALCLGGVIDWATLASLMGPIERGQDLGTRLPPTSLDALVLAHQNEDITVVQRLLLHPHPFIQEATAKALLHQAASSGSGQSLTLLAGWLESNPRNAKQLLSEEKMKGLVPHIVVSALLQGDVTAQRVWHILEKEQAASEIAMDILGTKIRSLDEPLQLVTTALRIISSSKMQLGVLPTREAYMEMFVAACKVAPPPVVSIFDSLVSPDTDKGPEPAYDADGMTSYCRCAVALLEVIEETGHKAAWSLPHLISVAVAGEDAATVRGAGQSHFSRESHFAALVSRAVRAATGILSSTASHLDEAWYTKMTAVLKSGNIGSHGEDELLITLLHVWKTPGSARVFSRLLKGLINFSGIGEQEAVHLLRLAQGIQNAQGTMASAIYVAVKELVVDSPVYDRIRNELAARLAGVPPSKASVDGVQLLKLLIDVAPPEESSMSLIPQQRCIFLLQTLQKWIASDDSDDFPQHLHTLLMQLLSHLLPIVQDVPGSHLAFMCDLMDINLSYGKDEGSDSLCVYHTLVLVEQFDTLAARNAMLREVWKESKGDIFEYVHDLFLDQSSASPQGFASDSLCHVLQDAVRIAPASLFTLQKDFAPLMRIVKMGSQLSKILAYRLLVHNIRETVKELVVEVALGKEGGDEEGEVARSPLSRVKIDDEIISFLQSPPPVDGSGDFAFLFAWLALFEHFEESSLQVKAAYTSQLQSSALVEQSLLPFLFATMDTRFDPSRWSLEEVYLDEVEESSEEALQVLTAHVFYRSLVHIPNLIRESFNGIKDRQQSLYLRNFIMRHLTPLLSLREFSHLRDASTLDRLTDENMSIKVLASSTEVIATYTVDEYPLEISIAMPNDYPLRNVEIKDLKKIGVSEGTWRAWILSIRQLIGSRNGLIFDALMLFKRNVEAKFSGFDEDSTCAVCYSIVSPTDYSLPTKPCKTCKKKFHASCLYKWVSTSGSSTCPLCRSIL